MKKIAIITFVIVMLVFTIIPSYSKDNTPQVAEGTVNEVDPVSRVIVLDMGNDEISIFVPSNTEIIRGTSTISIYDIEIGDHLKIEYYDTSPGPLKAAKIIDSNLAGDF